MVSVHLKVSTQRSKDRGAHQIDISLGSVFLIFLLNVNTFSYGYECTLASAFVASSSILCSMHFVNSCASSGSWFLHLSLCLILSSSVLKII